MRQPYNEPCKKCGSTNQTLMISNNRKSIFCSNCNNFEDIYSSEELKQHWANEAKAKAKAEEQEKLQQLQNMPKCPICGSFDIKKITLTKRAVKTALFGIIVAVDDSGKTYQCNNCKSKF